jgi:hypothetical protein
MTLIKNLGRHITRITNFVLNAETEIISFNLALRVLGLTQGTGTSCHVEEDEWGLVRTF